MKVGIIGAGYIGKTLIQRLSAAGHEVKVANSRGPETIEPDVLSFGARAVTSAEAVVDVDAVILSIPLKSLPGIAPLLSGIPASTVVIDTSNYYPLSSGRIDALEAGQVESLWVAEHLGRPVVKAWNNIADSLATQGKPVGEPDRIALPVAADREADRQVGMELVEDTGFDAFDAGTLAESWRQQPGAPAHATDLPREELASALAAADVTLLPERRDLLVATSSEMLAKGNKAVMEPGFFTRLSRELYM